MALIDTQKPAPGQRDGLLGAVLLDGEPSENSPPQPRVARLILCLSFNDDGHLVRLETIPRWPA
jgi:hypothetical protein